MRYSVSTRYAIVGCVAAVIFASCNGGLQSPAPAPAGFNPAQSRMVPIGSAIAGQRGGGQLRYNSLRRLSVTERVIHSFGADGSGDGYSPAAALLDVNGTFYGTTTAGGTSGDGTVFKITPSGKESVLHNFDSSDGAYPSGKLINVNGTLYGTTVDGGANGTGTVYSITRSGKLTTLHNFGAFGGTDGNYPYGALINVNGTLYGTTYQGGTYPPTGADLTGTIYSITTSGHETVLHSFGANGDGAWPLAGLINVKGTLYGTTVAGGSGGSACPEPPENCGTVFSVTTSGTETVLHSFSGPPDGAYPYARLTNVNGTFYGTTSQGGVSGCNNQIGCGTVFSIDASGNENVLYKFNGTDGLGPQANLLYVNGTFYGTTIYGGAYGNGNVFTITASGREANLYTFRGRGNGHFDGADPVSGLIDIKGTLYGTTKEGGTYGYSTGQCRTRLGCGTVFAITP